MLVASIDYKGCTPADTINGDQRYRVTWRRTLSGWTPSFIYSAPNRAQQVMEWLPSVGAVPVSGISASPGDETFTFDIRPAQSLYGRTLATLVILMDDPPGLNLEGVVSVEKITYISAADNEAQRAETIKKAEKDADRNVIVEAGKVAADATSGVVARFYSDVKTALGIGAIVLVIAIVAVSYGPNIAKIVKR